MLKNFAFAFALFSTACLAGEDEPDSQDDVTPVSDDAVIQTEFCADIVVVTQNVRMPCFKPNGSTGTQLTTRTCTTDRGIIVTPTVPPTKTCSAGTTTCTYLATSVCK